MKDVRKLEIFDKLLTSYLGSINGFGYGDMARRLKNIFSQEEVGVILINYFGEDKKEIIIREVDKAFNWKKYYEEFMKKQL